MKCTIDQIIKKDNQKGFTLVETIVYLALFVILLVGIINSVLMLTGSYRNVRVSRSIESSAINTMDRIIREVRNADSIDYSQSNFGINPSALSLNTIDESGNSGTVRFYVQGNRVYLQENGVVSGPLTNANVTVSSLVFRNITSTSSTAVKVEMSISSTSTNSVFITRDFQGTAVIRGSY